MVKILTIILAASWSMAIVAQEKVTGHVYDPSHKAIVGATVVMLSSPDSTYICGEVSDAQGRFIMERPQGDWMIAVSCLGYETSIVRPGGGDSLSIVLSEAQHQLDEVKVKGSRPVSQLTRDGFRYVIRGTTLAHAGNIEDVLAAMPLMRKTVNGYDVMGRGQAVFFVDGHRIYNLSELDHISSDAIKSLEVVTNPGPEYDASIKAVVRVTTYTNVDQGLSVDARSTWYQNRNTSAIEQVNLRYSARRWTVYDNFEYRLDNYLKWKDLTQTVHVDTLWNEVSNEQEHRKQDRLTNTAGLDYHIAGQSYVGGRYMLTLDTRNCMDLSSVNRISADGQPYDLLHTDGQERGHRNPSHLFNIYYSGTVGNFKINTDLDYLHSTTETDNVYDEASQAYRSRSFSAVSHVSNKLLSLRASVGHKLWRGDATVGVEYINTQRNDDYTSTLDDMPTSQSLLRETQRAAFADYSVLTSVGLFGLGIRAEHSQFTFHPGNGEADVSQSVTKVYPNLSWGIRIGQLQAQLLYSTEVNRPTYRQLSKNVLYGSRYTWQMGNPLLRPEYVHELTLQGVWRIVQFQFGYSDTRNAIINWGTQSAEHRAVSIMSYRNLPSVKEMRLAVVVSKGFGAWTPQLTTVMNKQFLHLTTGTGQYNLSSPIWIVKLSNNFQIGRTLSLFLTADYQSPGDYRNVHLSRNMWSVNFNAVKTLYHDRLSVQLKVNDIFNSKKDGNEIYNDQMVMHLLNRYDFRAVSVTLRYKLNSKDYKSHSHSDADQEIRRL